MTKLLNLDDLIQVERSIKIKGATYAMAELSVGDYIKNSREFASLSPGSPVGDQFEAMVAMICRAFPGMPREIGEGLTMAQLKGISAFISDDAEEEIAKQAATGETGKN